MSVFGELGCQWGRGNRSRGVARRGGPGPIVWTAEKLRILAEERGKGESWKRVGRRLKVSETSARRKAEELGLVEKGRVAPVWTEGTVKRLLELVRQDKSPREIAEELGGVSRNAVIGKLNRMRKKVP